MKKKLLIGILAFGLCCFGLAKKSVAISGSDQKVYGPKSDLVTTNQVAIMLRLEDMNKEAIKLLKEFKKIEESNEASNKESVNLLTEIKKLQESNEASNKESVNLLTEIRDLLKADIEKK